MAEQNESKHIVEHEVEQDDQQGASRTTDAFDLRRLERDPDPMQYTDERRLRNQIFCKARDLYLAPATAQLIDGLTELQAHLAVMVGGELGVYRADLLIFEHNGIVLGQPESTRVEALRKLLERLTDHWDNWQLNLALAGQ
ncbi:hypothetical protein M409DRAFT_48684 [Zasmidium cellare ATCC 36951]|uniref:Uncharacterized protein n=1 Tax=Zasmidium cellare ATCC 36951 TaxID=1080233 RepID=A0A6A6D2X7_ZASCE|nr:uncharacterized protein M409DRAFT_48684 [Zasmidium cellare ATCC 36951]KAF2173751.1 hypothetical protein M409DRAFT_48684 [Zasmidium cellare ATCC 36951]